MGAFQIVFIVINLAVPAWLYFRKAPPENKSNPNEIQWQVLQNNIEKLIVNGGGFPPCESRAVMLFIKQACQASQEKLENGKSWLIERSGPDVTFGCEVTDKYVQISWIRENNGEDSEMECANSHGRQLTQMAPLFEFNYGGRFRRIEYDSALGARETVPAKNCRAKLSRARTLASAPLSAFLGKMGSLPGDPTDLQRANHLCLAYDLAPAWKDVRSKIQAE